jgi:hypothetical protein
MGRFAMTSPPAARSSAAVIRVAKLPTGKVSILHLLPATVVSILVHGGLIAALIYVIPWPGEARLEPENRMAENRVVHASTANIDKLTGQALDMQARKNDSDFNFKSEVKAPVTNPGESDEKKAPGVETGDKDRPAVNVPKSLGTKTVNPGSVAGDTASTAKAVLEGLPPGMDLDTLRKAAGGTYGRSSSMRKGLVANGGGSNASEKAVDDGLKFLARHQRSDGSWCFQFAEFGDRGTPLADDVAPTALALLPFLGRGYTHEDVISNGAGGQEKNEYAKVVDRAVKHLIKRQDLKTGVIRAASSASADCYDAHCLATLALCELYSLSNDTTFKDRLKKATLDPAVKALAQQQLGDGGWRFFNRPDLPLGNMFVTGWVVQAFRSAELAGLPAPQAQLSKAAVFVERCADSPTQGYKYSYNLKPDGAPAHKPNFTESAAGLLCRMHLDGWNASKAELLTGIERWIVQFDGETPKFAAEGRKEKSQVFYWFFATQVLHHLGREYWGAWNGWIREELIRKQRGPDAPVTLVGSWDPPGEQQDDEPGFVGGRLLCTSLALMTLEVYYRQLPLYWRDLEN